MEKKHISWIELSKSAFNHNITLLRKIIGATVNLAIVIKGNAYGHGTAAIAQLCQENSNVDWLCTVSLSEAVFIRELKVTKPIIVLSFIDTNPIDAIHHNIDLMIQDMATLKMVHDHAQAISKSINIHIKIDTGMSRLGFTPAEFLANIHTILALPYIKIRGISSHFAESNNPASDFTPQQLQEFNALLEELKRQNVEIPLHHIANSAATISTPAAHGNFVRIGGAAYGLLPKINNYSFIPVATWKTTISFIRTIAANEHVGYDRTYTTAQETKIGILPVGYYHGYHRNLSNIGSVLIATADGQQHYAPIVGRICMNHTLIDVTHIENIQIGDVAALLGAQEKIHPLTIATLIKSYNPREAVTTINQTIERIISPEETDAATSIQQREKVAEQIV
ncbi:MAG TPA: alanine racemase [Candidatus Babeliales bacterium]|nr:alanine racemase [Candidatus Babeliales bacterium]